MGAELKKHMRQIHPSYLALALYRSNREKMQPHGYVNSAEASVYISPTVSVRETVGVLSLTLAGIFIALAAAILLVLFERGKLASGTVVLVVLPLLTGLAILLIDWATPAKSRRGRSSQHTKAD